MVEQQVGGIGQSYFCMVQWFMGALAPPSLACLGRMTAWRMPTAAGLLPRRLPCDFFPGYWWYPESFIKPLSGEAGPARDQDTDLAEYSPAIPTYDDFWRERSAWEVLDRSVPLYSSGVWGKMQLHTRRQYRRLLAAPADRRNCAVRGANAWGGGAEFSSVGNSTQVMLCRSTIIISKARAPAIWRARMSIRGARRQCHAQRRDVPPPSIQYTHWFPQRFRRPAA